MMSKYPFNFECVSLENHITKRITFKIKSILRHTIYHLYLLYLGKAVLITPDLFMSISIFANFCREIFPAVFLSISGSVREIHLFRYTDLVEDHLKYTIKKQK